MATTGAPQETIRLIATPDAAGDSAAARDARPALSPLFLHSSFRTGSTWLWRKLRHAPTTFCYYEIFNERLATMSVDQAQWLDHTIWESRHPASAPYFLEFLPNVAEETGIAGFDEDLSYRDFIPADGPDGALRPAARAYVARLIETAAARRRTPVLCCTRSLGRARALRAAFGGQAIFLHRNLFHQWASYWSLAEAGNTFFVETIVKTVAACPHDPFLRDLAAWFRVDSGEPTPEALFQVFLVLHLYLYSIAYDVSDLRIDVTALAGDRAARDDVERRLAEAVGAPIDLSDLRYECTFTTFADACPRRVRDTVEQFAKLIPATAMSAEATAFVDGAMQAALSEWDRFEFYNRRMRTALIGEIDAAKRLVQEREVAVATLAVENARLVAELAEARRALEASRAGERLAEGAGSSETDGRGEPAGLQDHSVAAIDVAGTENRPVAPDPTPSRKVSPVPI